MRRGRRALLVLAPVLVGAAFGIGWRFSSDMQRARAHAARLPAFEIPVEHPQATYRQALEAHFPSQHLAIDAWFEQPHAATSRRRVRRRPTGGSTTVTTSAASGRPLS
jgi:hypothetical protein